MRLFAIAFVVLGHGWHLFSANAFTSFMNHVWVFGVEIFFVLSGFLIGGILIKVLEYQATMAGIRDFWIRRWFRTLPNYYLFLLINLMGFGLLKDSFQWNSFYLVFAQNLAWMPDAFFSVSWSLAVEEWFYLILPIGVLCLVGLFRRVKVAVFSFACLMIVIVTTLRLYGALVQGYHWNEELRLVVAYRLDALMYGVVMAGIARYHNAWFLKYRTPMALTATVLWVLAIITKNAGLMESNGWAAALVFPLASLSFALFLPWLANWRVVSFPLVSRFVTAISVWSYSLYLIHVPALEFVRLFVSRYVDIYNFPYNILIYSTWIVLSIIASGTIYRLWELPMMNLRDRFSRKEKEVKVA